MGFFKKAVQKHNEKKALTAMYGKKRGKAMAKQTTTVSSHRKGQTGKPSRGKQR